MASSTIWDPLIPLASRMPRVVREHEILRLSATIRTRMPKEEMDGAVQHVLAWSQKRAGARLPPEAWAKESFEFYSGGRNSIGVRLSEDKTDIWAIRTDDPDKTVPGRTWTNEVVIGRIEGQLPRFSVRQTVSTAEHDLQIDPHSPGFVQQIVESCGLWNGPYKLDSNPRLIDSDEEADLLVDMMVDSDRSLPLLVVTTETDATPYSHAIDPSGFGRALLGLGHVIVLPARFTWVLTERFGRQRSVFGGAIRYYQAGFNDESGPYEHKLFIANQLTTLEDRLKVVRWIRATAASDSIRRSRLGIDVLPFSSIRNAAARLRQIQLESFGASESEQLQAAKKRIKLLESELSEERSSQDYYIGEHDLSELRAKAAEEQARASAFRIQQLMQQARPCGRIDSGIGFGVPLRVML